MRLVVGYVPERGGAEAVNLAVSLAGSRQARLDVVVVVPVDEPTFDMYSPDRAYHAALERQAHEQLEEALAQIPDGVQATGHVRQAASITEGLIDAARGDEELGEEAGGIVIGAAHGGLLGRFTIGSIASALLHASPVPVVLAPSGYESVPALTRITVALGTRQGADALFDVAIASADAREVPLRVMSLVALDGEESSHAARIESAQEHADELVARAVAVLPSACTVTGVVGSGKTLEACVQSLDFDPSEIVLLGSSRLAGPRQVFLGASANKILRALPVPIVVVPRDYETHPLA